MKYVDIELLTKEIDSLYDEWCGSSTGLEVAEEGASIGVAESIFEEVRKIIDSLQQEQPDKVDFEDVWKTYYDNHLFLRSPMPSKRDIARHFYELGLKARKL